MNVLILDDWGVYGEPKPEDAIIDDENALEFLKDLVHEMEKRTNTPMKELIEPLPTKPSSIKPNIDAKLSPSNRHVKPDAVEVDKSTMAGGRSSFVIKYYLRQIALGRNISYRGAVRELALSLL